MRHKVGIVPFRSYSRTENVLFARRLAHKMRDSQPTDIAFVNTTHAKALKVISPEEKLVEPGENRLRVRVFVMHGNFVDVYAHVPNGEGAPKGTWLAVSIDVNTGQLLDLSLGHQRPKDLSSLGHVERIEGG